MESLGFVDLDPPSVALETARATVTLKLSAGTCRIDRCPPRFLGFLILPSRQYAPPVNITCPLNVWCVSGLHAALCAVANSGQLLEIWFLRADIRLL
jgi:hypothetical protein